MLTSFIPNQQPLNHQPLPYLVSSSSLSIPSNHSSHIQFKSINDQTVTLRGNSNSPENTSLTLRLTLVIGSALLCLNFIAFFIVCHVSNKPKRPNQALFSSFKHPFDPSNPSFIEPNPPIQETDTVTDTCNNRLNNLTFDNSNNVIEINAITDNTTKTDSIYITDNRTNSRLKSQKVLNPQRFSKISDNSIHSQHQCQCFTNIESTNLKEQTFF